MKRDTKITRIILSAVAACIVTAGYSQKEETPYWHGVEREIRYTPDGEDFVRMNGDNRFTRALYGTNTAFRVETSDFPEFGLYMPNLGGSVYVALKRGNRLQWIQSAESIESRYRPGCRIYTVKDPAMLGAGILSIIAIPLSDSDGFIVKMNAVNIPDGVEAALFYGGANNERFSREGDLGADRADSFFIKPERCKGNIFLIDKNSFTVYYGADRKVPSDYETYENASTLAVTGVKQDDIAVKPVSITGVFPQDAVLKIVDADKIDNLAELAGSTGSVRPLLMASFKLDGEKYFELHNPKTKGKAAYENLSLMYDDAEIYRRSIAERITIDTPDPYFNTLGAAISIAGDAVWQSPVFLHGAIGWRTPLPGWRAGYVGDFLGWHDRGRIHFDAYAASQMTVPADKPVIMDTAMNLARVAKVLGTPMYSSGYISRSPNNNTIMHHYDMNLVYIDALLWHLNWTGDIEYARKIWPVIERHLAWEKLNFDPDGDGLYDAYCCIWASDALQYNGGGVTHSSAYNHRANKIAAEIAAKIGVDPSPYKKEAGKIFNAVNSKLWLKDKGWWAEYVETLGNKQLHTSSAVWTMYHAMDSDLSPDNFNAYQATRYLEKEIPHIPVLAKGLDEKDNYVVATTNWAPYFWSINNVAFAESTHTALAMWQAGESDKAFKLMKGTILDAMYIGKCPGNFGQVSFYDAARGETYRDFSDPVGIASRAIMQGMFGIYPDAMNGRMELKPGFPSGWDHASVSTPDLAFSFKRNELTESYSYEWKGEKELALTLTVPAVMDGVQSVTVNGKTAKGRFVSGAGKPYYEVECGDAKKITVTINWRGNPVIKSVEHPGITARGGDFTASFVRIQKPLEVYDPQGVLENPKISAVADGYSVSGKVKGVCGHRTLFVKVAQGSAEWYLPVNAEVREPIEILPGDNESSVLRFIVRNNTDREFRGKYSVGGGSSVAITLPAMKESSAKGVVAPEAVLGSNKVTVTDNKGNIVAEKIISNWEIKNNPKTRYETVSMEGIWNDRVVQIFRNKYLTPRYGYGTLQIPVQGIGEWCIPNMTAEIDDRGLRGATKEGIFATPMGVMFTGAADSTKNNIAYTSLWDNYPDSVTVPLAGKASHAYLLLAGSTNHMQSRFVNATVTVTYTDGSCEKLELINPVNWAPIEQDFYFDGYAFHTDRTRPYRVALKSGIVTRDTNRDLGIKGTAQRVIPGGAATILDMPLDKKKNIEKLTLKTEALEVVVGLMGVTLVR